MRNELNTKLQMKRNPKNSCFYLKTNTKQITFYCLQTLLVGYRTAQCCKIKRKQLLSQSDQVQT